MKIKEQITVERTACDLCKKSLVKRNKSNTCMICKRDICISCSYEIIKSGRQGKYKWTREQIGRICDDCYARKITSALKKPTSRGEGT